MCGTYLNDRLQKPSVFLSLIHISKDHKAQVITECDKTIFKKEKIQNKPRILIVDASEFNRAILKEILEETYEIIEACLLYTSQ